MMTRPGRNLRSGCDPKLAAKRPDVDVDGGFGRVEIVGDKVIVGTLAEVRQDSHLSSRERHGGLPL